MKQVSQFQKIANQLKNGNVHEIYNQMMDNNPEFKKFVEQNKGKEIKKIAQENGIDYALIEQLIR